MAKAKGVTFVNMSQLKLPGWAEVEEQWESGIRTPGPLFCPLNNKKRGFLSFKRIKLPKSVYIGTYRYTPVFTV